MRKNRSVGADGLLKSGLKLIGAKLGQNKESPRKKIYVLEPPNTKTYIEPFLGTGNVLMGKTKHETEILGDLNPYVVMFYRAMKENPERLFDLINVHNNRISEDYWKKFRDMGVMLLDPPTVGAWYYIINKYANNGIVRFNKSGRCNSTFCKTLTGRGIYDREWFDKVADRVKDVSFYNKPYQDLLALSQNFNPEETWIFCDPPYIEVETKYDKIDFKIKDHEALRDELAKLNCRWLLTINDHPLARELYKDFNIIEHGIHYSCSNTKKGRGVRPELFIANYDIESLWKTYQEQLNGEKKASEAAKAAKRRKGSKKQKEAEVNRRFEVGDLFNKW